VGDRLVVPDNIALVPLPPYAPELNPMENVWDYLWGTISASRLRDIYEAIIDACCVAWNKLIAAPDRIRSIASREWAKTVTP
jgi:transposase